MPREEWMVALKAAWPGQVREPVAQLVGKAARVIAKYSWAEASDRFFIIPGIPHLNGEYKHDWGDSVQVEDTEHLKAVLEEIWDMWHPEEAKAATAAEKATFIADVVLTAANDIQSRLKGVRVTETVNEEASLVRWEMESDDLPS